jgi:alpha-L-rhamnosidase
MEKVANKFSNFRLRQTFIFLVVCLVLITACQQEYRGAFADELQCNNMINPEGIDAPLLSWKIKSSQPGMFQTAWEIEIASSRKLLEKGAADIWKSGKQLISHDLSASTY